MIERLKEYSISTLKQIMVVVLAFLLAGVVLELSNFPPLEVYSGFISGAFGNLNSLGNTLRWAAPLILSGLAVAVAFKSSMWNLGIDGQFYLGAIAAAWVGYRFIDVPGWVTIISAMGAAAIVGGLWGAIPGWLRARTGASELVTTLMLNYVAILISDFMVLGPMRDPGPQGTTIRSPLISDVAILPRIIPRTTANIGFIIALVLAIILYFVIRRTTTGYEMRVAGSNRWFAQYGGISITRTLVTAMVISGAIAGLAGAVEVLGVHRAFVSRLSTNLGFDGIVVSLLAQNNPLAVIASGLFFGALRTGSMAVERSTEVPRAMVNIIQSIIIFGATAQGIWLIFRSENKLWNRIKDRFISIKPSST